MICANFTGGQAEELRRALSHKRSEQRMQQIETELRAGMTDNAIPAETQDKIVNFIRSFAAYGFPESHAASFGLLAYASAFLKVRYLAAFKRSVLARKGKWRRFSGEQERNMSESQKGKPS
jgi:error-prone DNA polymerase